MNIGSEEMVTINQLAAQVTAISGKSIKVRHVDGPLGVRGRNSDNRLISKKLSWKPSLPLQTGLEKTYDWIERQVEMRKPAVFKIAAAS
jgi:nucleoside-diphosphate-sugar epimerase